MGNDHKKIDTIKIVQSTQVSNPSLHA